MTDFIKCVSFQGNHSRRKDQWVEEMFLWVMLSQTCTNPKMNPFRFHWYLIFFPYSPIFHGDNDVKMSALLWEGRTFIIMWSQALYLIGGLKARILASCAHILCSPFFLLHKLDLSCMIVYEIISFWLHGSLWSTPAALARCVLAPSSLCSSHWQDDFR